MNNEFERINPGGLDVDLKFAQKILATEYFNELCALSDRLEREDRQKLEEYKKKLKEDSKTRFITLLEDRREKTFTLNKVEQNTKDKYYCPYCKKDFTSWRVGHSGWNTVCAGGCNTSQEKMLNKDLLIY